MVSGRDVFTIDGKSIQKDKENVIYQRVAEHITHLSFTRIDDLNASTLKISETVNALGNRIQNAKKVSIERNYLDKLFKNTNSTLLKIWFTQCLN